MTDATHAGLRAQYDPKCPECNGTGERDSGGTHTWGDPAMLRCDCDTPPAPQETAGEAVELTADINLFGEGWLQVTLTGKGTDALTEWQIEQAFAHPTPAAATTDNAALVERLNWPVPPNAKPDDEVVLPGWVIELCAEAAAAIANRPAEATSRERVEALPRLTKAMIEAACEAHYGKERARRCGGAVGIDLTVEDHNYTFEQGFRRMWSGIRRHLTPKASDEGEAKA